MKTVKGKYVKGFTKKQLYKIWLLIEEMGELIRHDIEAGGEGLEGIHERRNKIQKMIQKKRAEM